MNFVWSRLLCIGIRVQCVDICITWQIALQWVQFERNEWNIIFGMTHAMRIHIFDENMYYCMCYKRQCFKSQWPSYINPKIKLERQNMCHELNTSSVCCVRWKYHEDIEQMRQAIEIRLPECRREYNEYHPYHTHTYTELFTSNQRDRVFEGFLAIQLIERKLSVCID